MKLTQSLVLIFLTKLLFSQAGNLDMTFGDGGKMITEFEQLSAEANAIALQSDDKIVLTGIGISDSDEDIIAVRYLQNGQIDTEFGVAGKFILTISDFRDRSYDVETDGADNIFLTGLTYNDDFESKGFVIKLNLNGSVDSTFAQNGIWISETPDTREDFREILLQEDGKILIAGKTEIIGQSTTSTVIRLNPNGMLDTSFGENGIATADVPNSYNPRFAKLNSNHEIITGGFLLESSTNIILIKFNHHGAIDSSFGANGIMIDNSALDEFARSIVIQDNNKILVGTGVTNVSGRDFGLVRYNSDGTLDNTFGVNGKISTDFLQSSNTAHSILVQEDGKIVLTGFVGITPNHDYALARYDSLGNLDTSFGNSGKVITDFEFDDLAFASAIQIDGKLLCAGNSIKTDDVSSFSIARYFSKIETSTSDILKYLNTFKVFPNPSNGNFELSFELDIPTHISISVLDLSGNSLQNILDNEFFREGAQTIEVDINENFNSGIYFLRIQTKEDAIYIKVMIER